ncbi:MAG: 4'-phosphopantetheinyl transferase superfamily protein [Armatimonadota bacterium]|nr:4'-phosphopantetheinyl transferase superfamily protein [Armatimonadota bacterium]
MVEGIGIGIVEIRRLKRVLTNRPASLHRWFSEDELERTLRRKRAAEDLAGRYACKLAVRSAVAGRLPDGARLPLNQILTSNDPLGKPLATLADEAAVRLRLPSDGALQVSITHAREWAAAVATLSLEV